MTRRVSGFLSTPIAHLKPLIHSTVLDIEGIALASEVLAVALEPPDVDRDVKFIVSLCRFLKRQTWRRSLQGRHDRSG